MFQSKPLTLLNLGKYAQMKAWQRKRGYSWTIEPVDDPDPQRMNDEDKITNSKEVEKQESYVAKTTYFLNILK